MSDAELLLEVAQWLVMLVLLVYVMGLAVRLEDFRRRLGPDRGPLVPRDTLEAGSGAPELAGVDMARGRTLVAFLSASCAPCARLVEPLDRLGRDRQYLRLVVVSDTPEDGLLAGEFTDSVVYVYDDERALEAIYEVPRVPTVYLVEEGVIAGVAHANDYLDLVDLLDGYGRPAGQRWRTL